MKSGRHFTIATLLAAAVVLAAGALSVMAVRTQHEATAWVAHTHEVIARLEGTLAMLSTAESTERAYLLTGDERLLVDYTFSEGAARLAVTEVARLTRDNPEQQGRFPGLMRAVDDRFEILRSAIALRQQGQMQDAVALVSNRGIGQMRELKSQLQQMRQVEESLLKERLNDAELSAALGLGAAAATTVLALSALTGLYLLARTHAGRLAQEQGALRLSREQTLAKAQELGAANEQLRQSATLLEQRVAERTAALADANTELEGFSRTVAHDLRAPLRNIQGYAAVVLEDESRRLSGEGEHMIQRLVASARRMEALISDLLAYSRISRANLRLEPVPLSASVEQVLEDLHADLRASGARVEVSHPFPVVMANRQTLVRVIANLVGNSLKFVASDQVPVLKLRAAREDGWVNFCVADQGIGIPPEHQVRIFSVFERLHGQERYSGTGIGLAIVRKGVERMGGQVSVWSQPGRGSEFRLRLPAADFPGEQVVAGVSTATARGEKPAV